MKSNMSTKNKFDFFDVTADIGFTAYGNSLNECYENASLALFNVISNTDNIKQDKTITFEIQSEDYVSLLYDYLEELLFYHETEFMLFSDFKLELKDNFSLKATIKGEEIDWSKHMRGCEVKAITFHMMEVNQDQLFVKAILDL